MSPAQLIGNLTKINWANNYDQNQQARQKSAIAIKDFPDKNKTDVTALISDCYGFINIAFAELFADSQMADRKLIHNMVTQLWTDSNRSFPQLIHIGWEFHINPLGT